MMKTDCFEIQPKVLTQIVDTFSDTNNAIKFAVDRKDLAALLEGECLVGVVDNRRIIIELDD